MNPRFIALCGAPHSGKSEAQRLLHNALGYVPVDDGRPLREIAIRWFGLTERQVTTQEGKAETVRLNGKDWIVRDILGEIGNTLEEKFGGDIIPLMTMNHYRLPESVERGGFSFGSVRRAQGHFYRRQGGMVIEISRPGVGPSGNEYDVYDPTAVHYTIDNNADLLTLERALEAAVRWHSTGTPLLPNTYLATEIGVQTDRGPYERYGTVTKWLSDYASPND